MGILDDIARFGLYLNPDDQKEVNTIVDRVTMDKEDPLIRDAIIEGAVEVYLTEARPDIMAELGKQRNREMQAYAKRLNRKYDEKGDRICEESSCFSTDGVAQCVYCERWVCRSHNYGNEEWCCYACHIERGGKGDT